MRNDTNGKKYPPLPPAAMDLGWVVQKKRHMCKKTLDMKLILLTPELPFSSVTPICIDHPIRDPLDQQTENKRPLHPNHRCASAKWLEQRLGGCGGYLSDFAMAPRVLQPMIENIIF